MKAQVLCLLILVATASQAVRGEEPPVVSAKASPAFAFQGVDYFHRWSGEDQHEFTPAKQEDLEKWSDMITINTYNDAHDGERLASMANAVLENYKNHGATIAKTNSIPRTDAKPAEHLIVAVFSQPHFVEAAFARFKLAEGIGCSCVYSRRIYGDKADDQMSAWLTSNAQVTEKGLMEWGSIPSLASLSKK